MHRIRSQNNINVPTGIPDVLFFQPFLYGARDYSNQLPFDLGTLDEVIAEHTIGYPEFGCCEELVQLVEMLTEADRHAFGMPSNMEEGLELYIRLTEVLDIIDNSA